MIAIQILSLQDINLETTSASTEQQEKEPTFNPSTISEKVPTDSIGKPPLPIQTQPRHFIPRGNKLHRSLNQGDTQAISADLTRGGKKEM